jgi:hypothetical protein
VVARADLDALPEWAPGTAAVLSTSGAHPHAIPVSTAIRGGPRTILLALALRRESLARVREDGRCALTVMAGGNVAFTAHGHATIVQDPMDVSDRVAAVRIEVEAIQDHADDRFQIGEGVSWRWTDPEAEQLDLEIRAALSRQA